MANPAQQKLLRWLGRGSLATAGVALIALATTASVQIEPHEQFETKYRPYRVLSTVDTTPTCREIVLKPLKPHSNSLIGRFFSSHTAKSYTKNPTEDIASTAIHRPLVYVSVKQPNLQIQRPYTPIAPKDKNYNSSQDGNAAGFNPNIQYTNTFYDSRETTKGTNGSSPSSDVSSLVSHNSNINSSAFNSDNGSLVAVSEYPLDAFRLIVRRYQDGDVSRWLHSVNPGDTVEIKGPIPHWSYEHDRWQHITLVVGGTGITPALQLLQSVLSHAKDRPAAIVNNLAVSCSSTKAPDKEATFISHSATEESWCKFHLVYACRSLQECVLLDEIKSLCKKFPYNLAVDIFPDIYPKEISEKVVQVQSNLSSNLVEETLLNNSSDQVTSKKRPRYMNFFPRWIPFNRSEELNRSLDELSKSTEGQSIEQRRGFHVHTGPLFASDLRKIIPDERRSDDRHIALICGPEGFVRYIAGEPGQHIGEQGKPGGLLSDVQNLFKL